MAAGSPGRGRIDKREAILAAAMTVFAKQGYANAAVDAIAASAGVVKTTVYNHFGDKETLFRQAVAAESDRAFARNMAVVDRLREPGDLRELLAEVGYQLVRCYCEESSWALRRLMYTELVTFPELIDIVGDRATDRVFEALADRLARFALDGRLRQCDPTEAAEQFSALLTGPLESRARLGTRQLPDTELRAVAHAATRTFLLAYAP